MNWLKRLYKRRGKVADTDNSSDNLFIPVLCYHSWTINGPTYESNNHVALEHDLATLARKGYQILPVTVLLDVLEGKFPQRKLVGKKLVCITCDDGRDFDYYPYNSKKWGQVPGFHSILENSKRHLKQFASGPRAVSFVIASPEARAILDHTCGNGTGEWRDTWWEESAIGGTLGIANHSWDHVHDTLPTVRQRENMKGSFFEVNTFEDAESQIAAAQDYIDQKTGNRTIPVFGYPYGHVPAYLRDEYFPSHGERLGLRGAFGTAGVSVQSNSCIWDIPRFVCGGHWKTPQDFEELLDSVCRGER